MKKLLLVLAIGAFVASCNNSADSAAASTAAADSTAKADSIAKADSLAKAAAIDTTKKMVDTAAKKAVDTVKK